MNTTEPEITLFGTHSDEEGEGGHIICSFLFRDRGGSDTLNFAGFPKINSERFLEVM